MASLTIRVGASLDRDATNVYQPVVEAARRARSQISGSLRSAAAEQKATTRATANAEKAALQDAAREAKSIFADRKRRELEAARESRSLAKSTAKAEVDAAREAEKAKRDATKETEREYKKSVREREATEREWAKRREDLEKAAVQGARGKAKAFDKGVSAAIGVGGRALGAGASLARRLGGELASGIGVDTDLSSNFRRGVGLEESAVALSNQSYQAADTTGRNNTRVDPHELEAQARSVGTRTAFDPSQVLGGLQAFAGKTGDLATGREVLEDLAKLSKATGTNLEDMVDAAADVSSALVDTEDKGKIVVDVMKAIAGEGKLGAVEISDLAKQMAKLAANAGQFEGDTAENVKLLGVFAQEARQRGGATSAAQAATSVAGMVNTLKTPARVAAFKAQGIDVFNKSGQIRNPEEILVQALRKQGSDPVGFKKMYANVAGARAVEGFATIYRNAAATAQLDSSKLGANGKPISVADQRANAGEAAVRAEFDRLKKAAVDQTEINESFNRAMGTTASKVTVFNNEMNQVTTELMANTLPALKAIAPVFLEFVKTASDVIGKISGKTDEDLDTTVENDIIGGGRVQKVLSREQGQGVYNEEHVKGGEKKLGEMDADLAKAKERNQSESTWFQVKSVGRLALGALGGGLGVYDATRRIGSEYKEQGAREKDAEMLQAQRDQLEGQLGWMKELKKNGALTVFVQNMPEAGKPPPKVDPGGRTPEDK